MATPTAGAHGDDKGLMGRNLHLALVLAAAALLFVGALARQPTGGAYLLGAALMGGVAASAVWRGNPRSAGHILLATAGVTYAVTRLAFLLSTRGAFIPYGDGYIDYAVLSHFSESGRIEIIHGEGYPAERLTWYSQWPALHAVAATFIALTGVTPLSVALFAPPLADAVIILLVAAILLRLLDSRLEGKTGFTHVAIAGALLGYTAFPETLYWTTQFIRQLPAVLLFLAAILVFERASSTGIQRLAWVLMLLIGATVLTHHLSTAVLLGYLLLTGLAFLGLERYGIVAPNEARPPRLFASTGVTAGLVAMVAYWGNVGSVILPTLRQAMDRILNPVAASREADPLAVPYYPDPFHPWWGTFLIVAVPVVTAALIAYGTWHVWKTQGRKHSSWLLLISVGVFALMIGVDLVTVRIEVLRLRMFAAPFLSAAMGFGLLILLRSPTRSTRRAGAAFAIAVLAAAPPILLWGVTYVPAHVYDGSIHPSEVGEHALPADDAQDFLREQLRMSGIQGAYADDWLLLYLFSPPDLYPRVGDLPARDYVDANATLVATFRDGDVYEYYDVAAVAAYNQTRHIGDEDARAAAQARALAQLTDYAMVFNDTHTRVYWSG